MRRVGTLAVVLLIALASGCQNRPINKGVLACVSEEEWRWIGLVDEQYVELEDSGRYSEFLDRHDYLEATCIGVNAVRRGDAP
jgi:hypothetical protein